MPRFLVLLIMMFGSVSASALSVSIYGSNESCNNHNGFLVAQISGGVWPITLLWSTGAVTDSITGLDEGWYSVTVTDFVGTQASANYSLFDVAALELQWVGWTPSGGLPCPGQCNGGFSIPLEGINGVAPYSLSVTPGIVADPSYPHPLFMGFCDGDEAMLTVTDATGCVGIAYYPIDGPNGDPIVIMDLQGACNGLPNGSVSLQLPAEQAWDSYYYVYVRNSSNAVVGGYNGVGPFALVIQNLWPGEYHIERTHGSTIDGCLNVSYFTIPDLGNTCGTVSGDNWFDADGDCAFDAEVGVPYHVLQIQPGPEYALTNGQGHYARNLANGSYTLAQTNATLIPICPATQPVPFTINANAQVVDLADGSTEPLDLRIDASQGFARAGFSYPIWAQASNLSPQVSGLVTMTCVFDPQVSFGSAYPAPTSVTGNVITWDFPAFGSFAAQSVGVALDVPVGLALGTALSSTFDVTSTLPESTVTNNTSAFSTTVIGAYDPNTKTAHTSSGWSDAQYYIDQDQWIDYTIQFQNTGTASAIDVVVSDTLAAELDMGSFQQGVASHAFDVSFKPGRVVEWRFANIDLPDSNANEAASHGQVTFRIRPVLPLLPGTVIQNTANIFFDFNTPVITEPSVLVVEFSTGVEQQESSAITLAPVPASDELIVTSGDAMSNLRILAADGREVKRMAARSTHLRIELNGLKSGAYLLIAELENGTTARARFIIQ